VFSGEREEQTNSDLQVKPFTSAHRWDDKS